MCNIGGWRGVAPPPSNPPEARASAEIAGRGLAPLPLFRRVLMAERRTVTAAARVSPAELADWRAKAVAAVGAAAAGHGAHADVDRPGGRGGARAHPAGRTHRQQPQPDRPLAGRPDDRNPRSAGSGCFPTATRLIDSTPTLGAHPRSVQRTRYATPALSRRTAHYLPLLRTKSWSKHNWQDKAEISDSSNPFAIGDRSSCSRSGSRAS